MSDWQAGDLALAVGVRRSDYPNGNVVSRAAMLGKIFRVEHVAVFGRVTALLLEGARSSHSLGYWHSGSFRKIHPDEREACEPEFVTLLKRSKRKVEA